MVNKKGAVELSIGTIVIIVLAMSMLILGLVLVKNIFSGATYNVGQMNEKVKGEINKLFVEDQKILVYLPEHLAKASRNDQFGVAFAYVNKNKGTTTVPKFYYKIEVDSADLRTSCEGLSVRDAESWIKQGKESSPIGVAAGDKQYGLVRFSVPESAPLCIVRYNILVFQDNQPYVNDFFDLEIS